MYLINAAALFRQEASAILVAGTLDADSSQPTPIYGGRRMTYLLETNHTDSILSCAGVIN